MNGTLGLDEAMYARFYNDGDELALEMLVARWHESAFRIAQSICRNTAWAEEAVQDAFLKLVAGRACFKDRGPGSFRAWFLSIVTNCARMARRAEGRIERKRSVNPREYSLRRRQNSGLEASHESCDLRAGLGQALGAIEERWRKPVLLHFVDGMPQKEMAAVLGVSQQLVSRRLVQGLELLRTRLTC